LEVVTDWLKLMMPQRSMRPSIARVNEQLDPISRPTKGRRLST